VKSGCFYSSYVPLSCRSLYSQCPHGVAHAVLLTCLQGKKYSCSLSENSTVLCAVGNPLTIDDDVRFTVRLDPSKVVATADTLNLTLRVNTLV